MFVITRVFFAIVVPVLILTIAIVQRVISVLFVLEDEKPIKYFTRTKMKYLLEVSRA